MTFKAKVQASLLRHIAAVNRCVQQGMHFWDYGNAFLLECSRAGADIAKPDGRFVYPSYVENIMGPLCFDYGFGPFRWVCTSGKAHDLEVSDRIAGDVIEKLAAGAPPEIRQQYLDNLRWIRQAGENRMVVGSQARILYSDAEGRRAIAAAFNEAIKEGRISAPIVLGRDHHDVSGTDSPFRETANIRDGSMFCADMAVQNVIGDGFRGATWVSLHNGGGVGWGEVINGGFGMVLDGTDDADRRLTSMLHWDVNNGIARRAWARNPGAEFAIARAMESEPRLRVTLPAHADDDLVERRHQAPSPFDHEHRERTWNRAQKNLPRPHVAALDEILGADFPVLNDGLVRVVDYMGDDAAIVQAARVSYGAGTKKVSDDRGLIRYLLRHRHTTPFEMCSVKLHVRVPMDAWRQWIRHRTASVNETSTRYSIAIDGTQKHRPRPVAHPGPATTSRAAAAGSMPPPAPSFHARKPPSTRPPAPSTTSASKQGVAREQARKDLPLCTYTEAYWKMDLHNLLHFLALRMDSHAQKEIRDYATVIGREIVARWVPLTWEAFEDYRLDARFYSRIEHDILAAVGGGDRERAVAIAREAGWLKEAKKGGWVRHRERLEFEAKLASLNLTAPW